MALIKRTAFALLALATVTGCELLPIEDAKDEPGAFVELCEANIARVRKAAQIYAVKAGPDAVPATEALLVQQGLLDEPAELANVSAGQVVPVSDCVGPLAEAAATAATAPGATTTTVAPVPVPTTAPAPSAESTTTAPPVTPAPTPAPASQGCAVDYQTLASARDAFVAQYGRQPASEAELVSVALLTAEVAGWDLTATGEMVAAPNSGC